ncbi:hypothetical protein [Cryptosporangium aurantiacum]|uniref:Histidine kinase n=1 Tax=Cryptosporangium aurantiacum TaxID=134849 RepID=A0A1M7RPB3_9ACTN|nr:hypothetical protein [Cryptosporangium aurantiacum]SHN47908.1 hypothetical protein SAMN05443668_13011 [Cryptosporangium aurantiacum]
MADQSSANDIAARYAKAVAVSVVAIGAVWHFGYDVLILLRGWASYDPLIAELGAWLIVTVVQIVGSVLLLRDALSAATARVLAGVAVTAGVLAVSAYPPGQALSDVSWAWNTVGWLGVLFLLGRPVWEAGVLLAVNSVATLVALVADGAWDRITAARFLAVVCATVGVQMLYATFARWLIDVAREATVHAREQEERMARHAARVAVHDARQRRYEELSLRVRPLLRGLSLQRLDPEDLRVQRQAGIEAARLRRLFAETDDTDHPLLHELRACADVAERRGVDVTFMSYGDPPYLPTAVRRRLAEAPLQVLASADVSARVTVVVDATEVVISAVGDCAETLVGLVPDAVLYDEETNEIWVESRWGLQTPSQ